MRTSTLCGSLIAITCLVGCDKLADKLVEKTTQAQQTGVQAAQPEEEVDKDSQLAEKLSHYISCLNRGSSDVRYAKERYLDWIEDEEKGPTGKERYPYAPTEVKTEYCLKDLDEAKKLPPKLDDIEAAAQAYRVEFEKVGAQVKVAHDYYEQKNYKDDKFAKGKTMHPTLMAAFAAFEKVNDTFEKKVVTLNEEVGARQLAEIAKDPDRKLEHKARLVVKHAKPLLKDLDIKNIKELNAESFEKKLGTYEASVKDLDDFAGKNKQMVSDVTSFSSFVDDAKALLLAAKELSRRKRDDNDFTKFHGSAENVDGHPAQVISKFNDLIRESNGLRYDSLYRKMAEERAKAAQAQ